jgi:hypothetical protein
LNPLAKYLKVVRKVVAGPSSYTQASATAGWDVPIGELEKVVSARVTDLGGGEYLAQVYSIVSNNKVRVRVRDNIEQAVNEGGSATYTIGAELSTGANISGVSFLVEAFGY